MSTDLRELVRQRANEKCEYCHMPQAATPLISYHVEHIIAKQHSKAAVDDPESLAWSCDRCNAFKGTNLSSIDPVSGQIAMLFHPRRDSWHDHFTFRGVQIVGLTPTGRSTVQLLNMNVPRRLELRQEWLKEGNALS